MKGPFLFMAHRVISLRCYRGTAGSSEPSARQIYGCPGSSIRGKENHLVVHIAYEDALACARWRGHELPTEAQWEFAARGGRDGEDDWSSAFDAAGKPIANTWQGLFPALNTEEDGYCRTAPVGCFKSNGYGLYDMIGNVWEWTSDWYRRNIHARQRSIRRPLNSPASVPRRAIGEPRDQGRLASLRTQLLRPLPPGAFGCPSGLSNRAEEA